MAPMIGELIETIGFFALLAEIREVDRTLVPSTSEGPARPPQGLAQGCREDSKLESALNL
jgi:hypothetical protein